jgi:transposase
MCEVLNIIFHLLQSGGAWRVLPQEVLIWQTIYGYVRKRRNREL